MSLLGKISGISVRKILTGPNNGVRMICNVIEYTTRKTKTQTWSRKPLFDLRKKDYASFPGTDDENDQHCSVE